MDKTLLFEYFINKIDNNELNIYNDVLKKWFDSQLILLIEYLDETNEEYTDYDLIKLMIYIFKNQYKKREKIKNIKGKYNFFRKTLKKKKK